MIQLPRVNDEPWERIFEALYDPRLDVNRVTAEDIKRLTGREPRLMAKFDSYDRQPEVFQRHGVFILPVLNGEYVLVRGTGYEPLPKTDRTEVFHPAERLPLLTLEIGGGESQTLDIAFNLGLMEHFVGQRGLTQTLRGRHFSPTFRFRVGQVGPIEVSGVQYEVDQGYEGQGVVVLAEAKSSIPLDFHIRQLFYPYHAVRAHVPVQARPVERILSLFFVYDRRDEVYHLWEYQFDDPEQYNSIRLLRSASYQVLAPRDGYLTAQDIAARQGWEDAVSREWEVPQADDFEKVALFPFKVAEGKNTAQSIADSFDFTERQSSYYRHAAESLGLVATSAEGKYELTEAGRRYIKMNAPERQTFLWELMSKFPLIAACLDLADGTPDGRITVSQISEIIRRQGKYGANTAMRRALTVKGWLRWVDDHLGVVQVEKGAVRF